MTSFLFQLSIGDSGRTFVRVNDRHCHRVWIHV